MLKLLAISSKINISQLTLWLIFILSPFVDALTGFMINNGLLVIGSVGSPSQLFRFFVIAWLFIQVRKKQSLYFILLIVFWLVFVELLGLLIHNNISWLILGLVYSYKLAFGLVVYFVIKEYLDKRILTYDKLLNYIITSGAIYTFIVLISDFLGISTNSYVGANLGSKGVFADGNGMGVFLGVIALIVVSRYCQYHKLKDLALFFLMCKVLFGLMSKAGVLFSVCGLFLLFLKQTFKLKFVTLSILGVALLLFIEPIIDLMEISFKMIIWRLERTESIWTGVLGGRELYLAEMFEYNYNNFSQIAKLVLGGGYKLSFRDPSSLLYDPDGIFIIEADVFDIYFMYGVLGFIGYIAVFVKGFRYRIKGLNILKWSWALLFIHSALAGHVISSGIAMLIMPCLLLLMDGERRLINSEN